MSKHDNNKPHTGYSYAEVSTFLTSVLFLIKITVNIAVSQGYAN
jgi:hypothetical protein